MAAEPADFDASTALAKEKFTAVRNACACARTRALERTGT
jgi:hypothetical protein